MLFTKKIISVVASYQVYVKAKLGNWRESWNFLIKAVAPIYWQFSKSDCMNDDKYENKQMHSINFNNQ